MKSEWDFLITVWVLDQMPIVHCTCYILVCVILMLTHGIHNLRVIFHMANAPLSPFGVLDTLILIKYSCSIGLLSTETHFVFSLTSKFIG